MAGYFFIEKDVNMELSKNMKKRCICIVSNLTLLMMTGFSFAQTIVIHPNTIISFSKTYNNATLDMSNGSFIIKNNATLTLNNSSIIGTLSPSNPTLFTVDGSGSLVMNTNQVNITASNIPPHPTTQSLQYVIQVAQGKINLSNNTFTINQPYSAGFLITTSSIPTTGIKLTGNNISNFHGVFYLISSDNVSITNNLLNTNSYGNIVVMGNNGTITGNTITFSGNDRLGNSMDIINSNTMNISQNLLLTPTCHGIYILNSNNVLINGNQVFGGITYAINLLSNPEVSEKDEYVTKLFTSLPIKKLAASNIVISNNFMSQNRYGIAATDISNLTVNNNVFIQRFSDAASRQFWTNNHILLQNVTGLTWTNNLYKEAFTQDIGGDNSQSLKIVPFPQTGGVSLS
jgi:hypothetical protein